MGRVSKHKRIKACDPFYKGPRRVERRYAFFKYHQELIDLVPLIKLVNEDTPPMEEQDDIFLHDNDNWNGPLGFCVYVGN